MKALIHGPLVLFVVQALLVVVLSRVIGLGSRRMRQPMVIAEIVAGIALGPSLLGWLFPEFSATVFPATSLGLLGLVSQIGLILFMFLVGLEFDPNLLRGRGHASVAISHSSIVVPFALGALLAIYLHPRVSSPDVSFLSFTLFMGVAMSITAFPVLARILVERRLLRTPVGAMTITCAAVDDVTAWCILAFVVAVVRSTGLSSAVRTTILAIAYIGIMLIVVRPFLRRLADRNRTKDGLSQNVVAAMLALVLTSAWATELIGIHALFGAFVIGAVLPKEHGFARVLAEKLEDVVVVLLLPLFFAYSGLRTQIGLLSGASDWAICALIIFLACLGKFGGSAVAARLTGIQWREASAIGILMNTRGLMELVVLNIGYDIGVISPKLFTMMVLMALVTTFLTSPLLEWIYPVAELSKELAEPQPAEAAPAPQGGFVVLMCVAYHRAGPAMVTVAGALVGKGTSDRLYALRLVAPADRASFVLDQHNDALDTAPLVPLLDRAKALSVEVRPLSFVSAEPSRDICSVAEVKGASLVLLGWHKPLIGGAVLSGTVHDVMREAHADVGALIDRGISSIRRILVPYLGSSHDRAALRLSHRIAQNAGAEVTILHVVRPDKRLGVMQRVDEVFTEPRDGSQIQFKTVESEDPVVAALEECNGGYDLVLVGVGPEWGLEHRPFGSKAEQLIERCPTSMLIVRQYEPAKQAVKAQRETAEHKPRSPLETLPERG